MCQLRHFAIDQISRVESTLSKLNTLPIGWPNHVSQVLKLETGHCVTINLSTADVHAFNQEKSQKHHAKNP